MIIINSYIYATAEAEPEGVPFEMRFVTTASSTEVKMPIVTTDTSGVLVFDDGTSHVTGSANQATHTFASAGSYLVKYYGTATALEYSSSPSSKLTEIVSWGETGATAACLKNMNSLTTVATNLESTITDLSYFWSNNSSSASITSLDVSNVTNIDRIFYNSYGFNQDISGWDTGNVTIMTRAFYSTFSFNQDIDAWDVSNVNTMNNMFNGSAYAQDLSSWDTSSVTNFGSMFYNASSANIDMSSWDFSSGTSYVNMLDISGITTANYDKFLVRLNAQRITHSLTGRAIGDIDATYTTATGRAPRTSLLANGWTLTDDGVS